MIARILASLLLVSFTYGAVAQDAATERAATASLTERYAAAIAESMERGRRLFAYDQTAWHTTDALLRFLPSDRMPQSGGWVVEADGGALQVTYFEMDADTPYLLAKVKFEDGRAAEPEIAAQGNREALPESTRRLISARNAAITAAEEEPIGRCTGAPINTVVLPPDEHGLISVYFLTPQTENGSFPAGGHHRFDIASDGAVVFSRAFTNSCVSLELQPEGQDQPVVGFGLTHLLDPYPVETHVFLSLVSNVMIGVATMENGTMWIVENGEITERGPIPNSVSQSDE